MMDDTKRHSRNLVPAVAYAAALAAGNLQFALAQQNTAADAKTMPPVDVVGTRIKRTDWETAAPVQVLTREDIRTSGATSTRDLLNSLSSAGAGGLEDLTRGSGFSPGAATVSLHGLGSNATLVLINGRRFAPLPTVDPNGGVATLYNLNTIPLAAIERVEVLKGGASAIYGSDAIGGVVNIVLREDYRGAEAGVAYSFDQHGQFGDRRIDATIGFGAEREDGTPRYSGLLVLSNTKRDGVRLQDTRAIHTSELERLFDRNRSLRSTQSYPPNYFTESAPGNGDFSNFFARDARCPPGSVAPDGKCTYDQLPDLLTVGPQKGNSLWSRFTIPVTNQFSLFSEFGISQVNSTYTNPPTAVAQSGAFWYTPSAQPRTFLFVLPPGHPDNPATVPVALSYRFADLGPRLYETSNQTVRLLLGAKGAHAGWEWESALTYYRVAMDQRRRGALYEPALVDAINTQAYRPFGNNSPGTLAAISPEVTDAGRSTLASWDLKGTRKLTDLAGGPMVLAAGTEARQEVLQLSPDPRKQTGEIVGLSATSADARRHVESLFAELSVPFIKRVESQLALRFDRYSDYGRSTTPQFGIKWKPVDALALRASYAKGFRAPALSQIGNSSLQALVGGVSDPVRCGNPAASPDDCNAVIPVFLRATPGIKPEKSNNYTVGLVFAPNRDVDFTIDYYRFYRSNEIGQFGTPNVVANEAQMPGGVIRNPNPATWLPGVPNSGPIQAVVDHYVNLGYSRTSSVEAEANLRHSLGPWGSLKTQFTARYLLKYEFQYYDGDPVIQALGGEGPFGPLPRFKGSLATTWSYRNYALTGRLNHLSGWRYGNGDPRSPDCWETDPAYLASYNCRIGPWTTVDLLAQYTGIKNLVLGISVRNVQNKAAPLTPNDRNTGLDTATHNPYGRYFTIWMNYKFL
jgi:iron complex outermembrane receptor protein